MLQVLGWVLSSVDLCVWIITLGPVKAILQLLKALPKVLAINDAPDAPRRRANAFKELQVPFLLPLALIDMFPRLSADWGQMLVAGQPFAGSEHSLRSHASLGKSVG